MDKSKDTFKRKISEKLDIPLNILSEKPIVEIWGSEKIRIENHKGISMYSPNLIIIKSVEGAIYIRGENLTIASMIHEELFIEGKINSTELM